MNDGEAEAIFTCLAMGVRSYDQVVEVSGTSAYALLFRSAQKEDCDAENRKL